ncbi:YceD family protein [Actinophytocola glycyrrhizae]|uniref:YceD family protein n=1 Tax=Actinophytocola glycyrrhizae TaxID=2044873 RepID=A0ABV9S454_9PSEU
MSEQRNSPWTMDTRELARRPGVSRKFERTVETRHALGVEGVITVPKGARVELDVLLESVVEGVLVSGTAVAPTEGECSRCLDPISAAGHDVEVEFTELFAYPDSITEETTDEDEIHRLVDDKVDLEPVVRDAIVLALPAAPLCQEDCAGLCPDCGGRWADLGPDHRHETIDPRWAALTERFRTDRDA